MRTQKVDTYFAMGGKVTHLKQSLKPILQHLMSAVKKISPLAFVPFSSFLHTIGFKA